MHVLIIVFSDGPSGAWRFMFKDPLEAQKAYALTVEAMRDEKILEFSDDLGQKPVFNGKSIRAANLEDAENPEMKTVVAEQRRAQMGNAAVMPGPMPMFRA